MKIGILYPRSKVYPDMMADFMNGIKAALIYSELDDHIQIVSESIGFGGNEKEVYDKTEKILVLEAVDILIAYIDLRVLEVLKPLLNDSGKLILVVNPGANYPGNWVCQPNILHLTLQHGFLCWLSGKLAKQANKVNAVMATSFYDCGYLHTAALVNGFAQSGGAIRFNYVNNQSYDDSFNINQLTDYLSTDSDTNSLLCVFDSLPASIFYSRINSFSNAGDLHLFVSPMMLEAKAIEHISESFKFSIDGYLPWHSSIESIQNRIFMNSYQEQSKRSATVFSLLGWETGLIVQQVFQNSNNSSDGAAKAEQLKKLKINSPRGVMHLDDETNYFVTPVLKCSVKPSAVKLAIQIVEHPQADWEAFIKEPTEGNSSGWTNTYLCY